MLTRTLLFLSLLCCTAVLAQELTPLQQEAARFHREAQMMYQSGSHELAFEHASAAFALDPEKQEHKDTYVHFASHWARILLAKRTSESMAQSLILMNRVFELLENDPRYFNHWHSTPLSNLRLLIAAIPC